MTEETKDDAAQEPIEPTQSQVESRETDDLHTAMWDDKPEGEEGGDVQAAAGNDEAKPEDETAPEGEDAAKPGDDKPAEINDDELIKGLSTQAQQRFRELANSAKENKQNFDKLQEETVAFREMVADAQITPQDMLDLLDYGKAIRSGDFGRAREVLQAQMRQLAIATGETFDPVDPLSAHPDLRAAVNEMEITEKHALELARARDIDAARQGQQQRQQQALQQTQQQAEATQQAFNQVAVMANGWRTNDIDWPAKQDFMMAKANEIQQSYPPHLWTRMIQDVYDTYSKAIQAAAQGKPRTPQPLRPGAKAGGQSAPASLHEAMWGEPEQNAA